jgi:uncharacterized membrane protein
MPGTKTFLSGLTLGAGLVYFLDPERGSVRRERWSRQLAPLWDEARRSLGRGLEEAQGGVSHYGSRIGDLQGLEAANLPSTSRGYFSDGTTASALRFAGAALAVYGLLRRGALGAALRTLGAGIAMKAPGWGGASGIGFSPADRRRAVDIQKTLHINAPLDQVYAFWSNYENFPLFMSHVREVEDLGAGRSHWRVSGPGGVPIEWFARLTQDVPNEVIAWRSEAGSMLENAGVIRFSATDQGTRVDLRFCYHPPAGGAGEAVAELLGSDPRAKLNQDLGRMKALLEATTRSESHGKESRP